MPRPCPCACPCARGRPGSVGRALPLHAAHGHAAALRVSRPRPARSRVHLLIPKAAVRRSWVLQRRVACREVRWMPTGHVIVLGNRCINWAAFLARGRVHRSTSLPRGQRCASPCLFSCVSLLGRSGAPTHHLTRCELGSRSFCTNLARRLAAFRSILSRASRT